ncbi:IS66 family transposase [Petroclostridium sp. X23]|uniref:IS66 family transposase n=1 Tax=Petroclostridium sp. X23 TaxID=3045146 RepID=UPI0024ADB488|nr:IS66 family transposase [Petroclostridium sp. X23]WHH59791.1 IS66 family transposase [Petroclostridium sp. X23]
MTENEELQMLRALVEKQKRELEAKDKIIEKQNIQIENMIQALLHARKKLFGASTEVTKHVDEQMNLFETTQELAKELFKEQKKITVPSYQRTARQPGVRAEMLAGIPKEVEEYIIPPEENCSECGEALKVIGKKLIRTEVEFIPAKLKVVQVVQEVAKCTRCGKEGSENPKDHFQKAAVPTPVLPHSIATASLVAQVMYQKFAMGIPFNRQEKDWYRMGLVLPRANMANWTIRCSEEWLTPIYNRIHEELLKCEVLHMDETRIQCNKEEGKKASSDSFMWVIRSAACEEIKGAYFYYSRTRSGEVAKMLLNGFHGYLTTDAYAGYEKAEGIKRNLCWAHCRRYLIESIPLDNKGKEIPGSKGAEGREFINLLFKLEDEMKELTYEEKKEKRQVASRAILDAFWSWVEETSALSTTNENLTKALNYAKNQKKYLETFLEDGRLPISNNLCEANIKPYATARRAWLFADTPKGATANAILYTIVESAKANDLDVYEYLRYILASIPDTDFHNYPEILNKYLPWSKELPEKCRLNQRNKKCFQK